MRAFKAILTSLVFAAIRGVADEHLLDRFHDALSFNAFDATLRGQVSGLADLEGYFFNRPAPGLLYTDKDSLISPRLTTFLDLQIGPSLYLFVQGRVDRGFDPADAALEARADEYALRYTPWDDGRFNVQVGKAGSVTSQWASRHLSWENPFITGPLAYEHRTAVSDEEIAASVKEFLNHSSAEEQEYTPIVWGPAYGTGASAAGRIGKFDYAAEIKNTALSARPSSWDATEVGFDHPTLATRLGFRPNVMWNLGIAASDGAYLRPEAFSELPANTGIGDFHQRFLAQDISFAWHRWQLWAEFIENRFEVPNVGNADVFGYFLEAKYKICPHLFGAIRWNQQYYGSLRDDVGRSRPWDGDLSRVDLAVGYRPTPHTQIKVQASFSHERGSENGIDHLLAAQFTVRF